MTSPSSSDGSATPSATVAGDAVEPAQQALATEHAAAWCYSLVGAFLPAATIADGAAAHQSRRDGVERLIKDSGATPVPAQASYTPPKPVTDATSAYGLLATAESDCAQAWRSVLEHTDDAGLRRTALDALTSSAVRGTRWRQNSKDRPSAVAFPGQPT